jgi:hypothetical protein
METRTITILAAGALGVAVGASGLLLSQRATAAPPPATSGHMTQVACPATMVARTGGWMLSSGPWKPTMVTPPQPTPPMPVYGPFMKGPEGTYELPSGAAIPSYTFKLSGVFAEPFTRMLKCEYAGSDNSEPYVSFTVTQPYPAGQECLTTAGTVNTRTFQCQ